MRQQHPAAVELVDVALDGLQVQVEVQPLAVHEQDRLGARLQLLELDGLIGYEDPAWIAFQEKMGEGLLRISILGAYPRTLDARQAEQSA